MTTNITFNKIIFMYRSSKNVLFLTILIFIFFSNFLFSQNKLNNSVNLPSETIEFHEKYNNPQFSPDNTKILFTDNNSNAVYVLDSQAKEVIKLGSSPSSGYKYYWSPDGKKIGFKALIKTQSNSYLQVPVVYDVTTQKSVFLNSPVPRCGIPSFSVDGKIAYSIDNEIIVIDTWLWELKRISIPIYSNITPISPDGNKVLYNDKDDQIWLADIDGFNRIQLTNDGNGYFNPVWSPDSNKVMLTTISGDIKVIDLATRVTFAIDSGLNPSWNSDSQHIIYKKLETDGIDVKRTSLNIAKYDGNEKTELSSKLGPFTNDTNIFPDNLSLKIQPVEPEIETRYRETITRSVPMLTSENTTSTILKISNVPHIHQVLDVPDWFDGNSCCSAASVMQIVAYYGILPYWDCISSSPTPHISHYGRYICEQYTFNGFNYNLSSNDSSGHTAYGAFGFIFRSQVPNMVTFLKTHYLTDSYEVWGSSWTLWPHLVSEIDSGRPFALLNYLVSGGHWTTVIGYGDNHTVIFNDTYGDKNSGGYAKGNPHYDGAGATYDWPGYNNGYCNLNIVQCFVYGRGYTESTSTYKAALVSQADSSYNVKSGSTATISITYHNYGTLTWTANTRLGTTNPRDRTSVFYDSITWISTSRPTAIDTGGSTATNGLFKFIIKAPDVTSPTSYTEYFNLVHDDNTTPKWFSDDSGPSDTAVSISITVSPIHIKGYVKRSSDSKIEGVTMTLSRDSLIISNTTTNNDGYYEFTNLISGNYMVTPTKTGYSFNPDNQNYDFLSSDQDNQNFVSLSIEKTAEDTVKPAGFNIGTGASIRKKFQELKEKIEKVTP